MTEMNEVPVAFTRDDIDGLTDRLGELVHDHPNFLSPEEWSLLVAIFAAAANHVEIGDDPTEGTFSGVGLSGQANMIDGPQDKSAAELTDQLRGAYVPGKPPLPIAYRVTPRPPHP